MGNFLPSGIQYLKTSAMPIVILDKNGNVQDVVASGTFLPLSGGTMTGDIKANASGTLSIGTAAIPFKAVYADNIILSGSTLQEALTFAAPLVQGGLSGTLVSGTFASVTQSGFLKSSDWNAFQSGYTKSIGITSGSINFMMTGGGFPLNSGYQGTLTVPYSLTLQSWNLLGDVAGNLQVDIRRQTYANYNGESIPSTSSICGGNPPVLSNQVKNTGSATLFSGLNTADILEFNINATPSGVTIGSLSLIYTKN